MRIRMHLIAMASSMAFFACAGKAPEQNLGYSSPMDKPTLTVSGFSCELGGKKCKDRRAGREAIDLTVNQFQKTDKFYLRNEEAADRKHMQDVADMLWSSGESEILVDLIKYGKSEYLAYGRVFEFNQQTRVLSVELTLVHRDSERKVKAIGKGSSGSMESALADAVQALEPQLASFLNQ